MLISRRDSYLHPDSFTFIMASIILSPKSRQSYKMSIETSKAPQEVEMFIPKFLDTGFSIFSGGSQLSVINNTANVMLGNHQFAGHVNSFIFLKYSIIIFTFQDALN
ncbi:unnamed protein product [Trichobilharzia regenti]|nr:unnamed protein product [Trichobilharzia regenti]